MAPCKRGGCAFFGSDANDGYCSKCFKLYAQQPSTTTATTPMTTTTPSSDAAWNDRQKSARMAESTITTSTAIYPPRLSGDAESSCPAPVQVQEGAEEGGGVVAVGEEARDAAQSEAAQQAQQAQQAVAQDGVMRCYFCNKRLKLVEQITCRCGNVFCVAHRHFETHSCTYDYKTTGRAAIAKANPVVTGKKVEKI